MCYGIRIVTSASHARCHSKLSKRKAFQFFKAYRYGVLDVYRATPVTLTLHKLRFTERGCHTCKDITFIAARVTLSVDVVHTVCVQLRNAAGKEFIVQLEQIAHLPQRQVVYFHLFDIKQYSWTRAVMWALSVNLSCCSRLRTSLCWVASSVKKSIWSLRAVLPYVPLEVHLL